MYDRENGGCTVLQMKKSRLLMVALFFRNTDEGIRRCTIVILIGRRFLLIPVLKIAATYRHTKLALNQGTKGTFMFDAFNINILIFKKCRQ
jgi:hypothetical protein